MKQIFYFLFCVFVVFSPSAHGGQLSGFVVKEGDDWYLIQSQSQAKLSMTFLTLEGKRIFDKLKSRDFFLGNGQIRDRQVLVESIDFVGIRGLLGIWASDSIWFNFKTFSTVNIFWNDDHSDLGRMSQIQYSVAPGNNKGWKVFFSDVNQVQIASLHLDGTLAKLDFYDPDTGEIRRSYNLRKLSSTPLEE